MVTILITGGKGQLGTELGILSKNFSGYDFITTDVEELDICDMESVNKFVTGTKPDWIINCAAYNGVDKAETDQKAALLLNAGAINHIVTAIRGTSTKFVHISTDYVFDGSYNRPYNEEDSSSPSTAYGFSKRQGEIAALRHQNSMVIRTSWLYSPYGSNFVKTIIKKGLEKGTLNVVFDQIGTPTNAGDLAKAIMEIVSGSIKNKFPFVPGTYHYSNEGVCSWYDFAVAILEESDIECSVTPVLSSSYQTLAKRPFYSVLDKSKIKERYNINIPHWRSSLRDCIKILSKNP